MLSPQSRTERSFSPKNQDIQNTSNNVISEGKQLKYQSIRNIQKAYQNKMQQVQSTRNSTANTSVPPSKTNTHPINEQQQLDTQVMQLCQISPRNSKEQKETTGTATYEHDTLTLDQLHKQIEKSQLEKQEQLKKLQSHFTAQESMIEN